MSEQGPIDEYLARLRQALRDLPAEDVEDILREFRSHIIERTEAMPGSNRATIERILSELGNPEEIGSIYRTDALVARARTTLSPVLIVRTTFRWATRTILGFVTFLIGVFGYGFGLTLIAFGVLKPLFANIIGLWIDPQGMHFVTTQSRGHGLELMGWWLIPSTILVGALAVAGTTLLLRWMLRFASRPVLPTASSA